MLVKTASIIWYIENRIELYLVCNIIQHDSYEQIDLPPLIGCIIVLITLLFSLRIPFLLGDLGHLSIICSFSIILTSCSCTTYKIENTFQSIKTTKYKCHL